jgi:hypothetical protein
LFRTAHDLSQQLEAGNYSSTHANLRAALANAGSADAFSLGGARSEILHLKITAEQRAMISAKS